MPYKVLVVDDSKLARMAVARALDTLHPDWTRAEASSAEEALSLVKQSPFDIALLDFNMPDRDGLHLAADLRAVSPDMALAVVSANHQKEIVSRAHAVGAEFLAKPLTEQALKAFLATFEIPAQGGRVMAVSLPLNELELDALTELVNIGVSSAATSLREMVSEEVILSVPKIDLVLREHAVEILRKSEAAKLVAVHQVFEGDISGRALLIFPEAKSLEIVRAVSGSSLSLEDIIELEQEALAETGNIILNGCLATIANMLDRSLKMSLPEVLRGDATHFFNLPPPPHGGELVLFVYINFAVQQRDIRGYIAMLMDMPSLVALKVLLDEFIERTAGRTTPRAGV